MNYNTFSWAKPAKVPDINVRSFWTWYEHIPESLNLNDSIYEVHDMSKKNVWERAISIW